MEKEVIIVEVVEGNMVGINDSDDPLNTLYYPYQTVEAVTVGGDRYFHKQFAFGVRTVDPKRAEAFAKRIRDRGHIDLTLWIKD